VGSRLIVRVEDIRGPFENPITGAEKEGAISFYGAQTPER
jgi:hypothetical protein